MNTFGKTTARLRERKEWTRRELAQRAQVSSEWIARLEQGRMPQVEYQVGRLRLVAAALGYSLAGFLREVGLIEKDELGELSGDPGLRQLVADYSALRPEERDAVDALIRLLSQRGDTSA